MRAYLMPFLLIMLLGTVIVGFFVVVTAGYAPREWARYLERRASGNIALIAAPVNAVASVLESADRPTRSPQLNFPLWNGIGAQSISDDAVDDPGRGARSKTGATGRERVVSTMEALREAVATATAGDAITLLPGRYRVEDFAVALARPGSVTAPIRLRAARLDTVTIEVDANVGVLVAAPFWIIENLVIRGACRQDDDCEHAIQVVGDGGHVVIRNNRLEDFNAQIKVNGVRDKDGARFPDAGLIERNTLRNAKARDTARPVTPIDVVAASGWLVRRNVIADFSRMRGDQVSYGAFFKGAGVGNRFDANLVACEHRLVAGPGARIGLSFGGGGSTRERCRDGRCLVEHERGIATNNVIVGCSDAGFYLNRAPQTRLEHNTLIDTAGIVVRFGETTLVSVGNLIDGEINARHGGFVGESEDLTSSTAGAFLGRHPVRDRFIAPAALDLRWRTAAPVRTAAGTQLLDLCGQKRPVFARYGAFESIEACLTKPAAQ